MKTEIAVKWIQALESGDYPQGKGKLRAAEGFCCLGVLCDLFKKETGKGKWERTRYKHKMFSVDGHRSAVVLPLDVMYWAGLLTIEGELTNKGSLVGMNDRGKTFQEIAKVISENVAELQEEENEN